MITRTVAIDPKATFTALRSMSQRTARHASQSKSNMSLYCPECRHQSALSCKNDRSSPTPLDIDVPEFSA